MESNGRPRFTYIALSHSVSSIVVTGAIVATLLFSYTYSCFHSGDRALVWAWTGYVAAASHLIFVFLEHQADIPVNFYLPTAHTPQTRMIGLGWAEYAHWEMIFMFLCVAYFLTQFSFRKWFLFGLTLLVCNYLVINNLVWTSLTKGQFLLAVAVVSHLVPLWAHLIERNDDQMNV